ncbi:Schwann cell myelin protein [Portunus trituberculatus]|uniref:Schwann cell myelin protein n=1 Tax=Portunus trituberculatus TaxID=210409 RepID=A0A5B7HHU8_PORTR|nr:Schwann cell myelin protein [Portunus trituberculatus]
MKVFDERLAPGNHRSSRLSLTSLHHTTSLHSITPTFSFTLPNTIDQDSLFIISTDGPMWVFTPVKFVDVQEGNDVTLTASAEANPGPVKYKWYHGRQKLDGIETETGDGLLKLEKVQRDMGGNYSVTASSVHGAISSSFTVNVLYGPRNMSVPERVLADRNETVSIHSILAAGVGDAQLVVDWATPADTGVYLCHATNEVSTSVSPARTVLVVPREFINLEDG